MGSQFTGRMLSKEELNKNSKLIKDLYRESVLSFFSKYLPKASKPKIISAGSEIETQFIDHAGNLAPIFHLVEKEEVKVQPEFMSFQGEVITSNKDLFNLETSLEFLTNHYHHLFNPLSAAALKHDCQIMLAEGHPAFSTELAERMLSPQHRYQAIKDRLEPYTQKIRLQLKNGETLCLDNLLGSGYASSLQTTIKIPQAVAHLYLQAYNLIAPIMLAVSSSSPAINHQLTKYNSTRVRIISTSLYGYSDQEKEAGQNGRCEIVDCEGSPSNFADHQLYAKLKEFTTPQIAKYMAEISGNEHLLISEDQLNSHLNFPEATAWPLTGKLKYNLLDQEGIGLELRLGGLMPNAAENAAFVLTTLASLQALVELGYHGKNLYLSPRRVAQNILVCSQDQSAPKEIYWPERKKIPLSVGIEYLEELATLVLQRDHSHPKEIIQIFHQLSPAERMRCIAYQKQPKTSYGQKLEPETIQAMIEPSVYKN